MNLTDFGWNDHFASLFEPYRSTGLTPARVIRQHRERCVLMMERGEVTGEVSGRFRHLAADRSEYPTTGDWVAAEPSGENLAVIHAVLPRRSAFTRKVAGELTEPQVVAANIDTVLLLTGLDANFNVRRIERYLTTAWDSGASPVIVLNKADLRPDIEEIKAEVGLIAAGIPVVAVSALEGSQIDTLLPFLAPRKTAALLGSSGVGKTTLINRLLGEQRYRTQQVSDSVSRGRHTTTHRELVVLPNGALLIDTPGMRELQLWADDESLGKSFEEIESLTAQCRFADCRHQNEPGCAVQAALADGSLDAERFESYLKQRKELKFLTLKQDSKARKQAEKVRGRHFAAMLKEVKRRKPNLR